MAKSRYDLVVVTGPTASGKTAFASLLACRLGGEIISADSRQVYRGMDIGTGKDYSDYCIEGRIIPFHMVDIVDAGQRYNLFEYQTDFLKVYNEVRARNRFPVVCGGSGMYLDSILSGYRLIKVPVNKELRAELENETLEQLTNRLKQYKNLHNKTDIDNHKRAVRAIEIEEYYEGNRDIPDEFPQINALIIGIEFDRESRRRRITERLKARLKEGMIEEVEQLIRNGIAPEDLIYYGLEYKYLTLFLVDRITYEEMFRSLETAIHQFAKRQMTWFRGMERKGFKIHWLDGYMSSEEKLTRVLELLE
ncbi:MAG TPA: tRNA (adenosine(37)-N6)-dimethylallyltransferase MiaA [Bacteroidales bacterium]|nr:tRNA (adenosine(37)-N6)-dimethylallyltransferase MiaA [Bacteroidales bacterium]